MIQQNQVITIFLAANIFCFVIAPKTLDFTSQPVSKARFSTKRKRKKKLEETNYVFSDVYELTSEVLGSGAVSTVTECIKKTTGVKYAVKVCFVQI